MNKKTGFPKLPVLALVVCALLALSASCKKSDTGESSQSTGTTGTPADSARWVTEKQGLRLRESPEQTGKIIAVIPCAAKVEVLSEKGETLTIAGSTGKWTEVNWSGRKGWVFGGFLGNAEPCVSAGGDRDLIAAAERYHEKFVKQPSLGYSPDQLNKLMKSCIRVAAKSGNFAIIETGIWTEEQRIAETNSLWVKAAEGWKVVVEVTSDKFSQSINLLHLNNDDLIDAVVTGGGGDWSGYAFYLGKSAQSMEKIDSISLMIGSASDVALGRCEKTSIKGYDSNEAVDAGKKVTVTFDCAANRLKKTYQ